MAHSLFRETNGIRGRLRQVVGWISEAHQSGMLTGAISGRPLWAQLNITKACNLDCGYCSEHEKHGAHVPYATVESWIHHAHSLGLRHLQFIGGEPLLHPDFPAMIQLCHKFGIATGLTTNGFLVHRYDMEELIRLGMNRVQVSVDVLTPNTVTRKALSVVRPVLEKLQALPVWLRANTVVTEDSVEESRALAEALFAMEIPVAFSPVHDQGMLVRGNDPIPMLEFLEWAIQKKQEGQPVDMPYFLLRHYQAWFRGEPREWTCDGGSRAFYVDADGGFRNCTHTPPQQDFLETSRQHLASTRGKPRGCERNCGVQCMLIQSLPFHSPGFVLRNDLLPQPRRSRMAT